VQWNMSAHRWADWTSQRTADRRQSPCQYDPALDKINQHGHHDKRKLKYNGFIDNILCPLCNARRQHSWGRPWAKNE
jgi:hypothetical protein